MEYNEIVNQAIENAMNEFGVDLSEEDPMIQGYVETLKTMTPQEAIASIDTLLGSQDIANNE